MAEGERGNDSGKPALESSELQTTVPVRAPGDTDSVYDDVLVRIAHTPEVDPVRLAEMNDRVRQESLVGKRVGHFQVLAQVGSGGMGVVYRAEDEVLRRPVALKVLSSTLADPGHNQWLLDEARHAAAVSHPNIAAIYEADQADGVAFIAMEYVDGQSLRARLNERPFTLEEALRIATEIARGLGRAHQAGIIHRDLKPDNVMLGQDGFVKILDFGLARPVSAQARSVAEGAAGDTEPRGLSGRVVGTLAYMSPEQARGEAVDARSDVFSFGVLLFELLTGRRPHPADARSEVLQLELPGAPRQVVKAIRELLARCLEARARDRFPDGAALVEALRDVQARLDPGSAGLPMTPARLLRRRSFWWASMTLVLVGVILYVGRRAERVLDLHERRLTANPADNLLLDAALAPDGRSLAYADRTGLYLRRLEPERTEPLFLPPRQVPDFIDWFPGGDELLVTSIETGKVGRNLWRIRVSSGEHRLVGRGSYDSLRVAPDGATFAWRDESGSIRVGPVDLSTSRVLVQAGQDERLGRPSWSPDGERIAYLRISQITATLETVDLQGGAPQVLLRTPRLITKVGEGALVWSPDAILFAMAELPPGDSGFSLWRLPLDGKGAPKGAHRLLRVWTGLYPDMMSLGANGRLAYARYEYQADVYLAELEDGGGRLQTPTRLTLSERDEYPSGFSPDGRNLLYTSDQDGNTDLFLQSLDGGLPHKLVTAVRDFRTWPAFTPSGDEILFWRYPWPIDEKPRHAELMRMAFPSGTPVHVLTSHSESAWTWDPSAPWRSHFRCARSGCCLLGEIQGESLVLSTFDPRGARGAVVESLEAMTMDAHSWDVSPDCSRVVLPGGPGQYRILSLATKEVTAHPVRSDCLLRNLTWSADGASIFATGECSNEQFLTKVFHVVPGQELRVLFEKSSTWFSRPIVSPDGKRLAFAALPLDNDVWLLSGL